MPATRDGKLLASFVDLPREQIVAQTEQHEVRGPSRAVVWVATAGRAVIRVAMIGRAVALCFACATLQAAALLVVLCLSFATPRVREARAAGATALGFQCVAPAFALA